MKSPLSPIAQTYLATFPLQAAIGAAIAMGTWVLWRGRARRSAQLWTAHWTILAASQLAALAAASAIGIPPYRALTTLAWGAALGGFAASGVISLAGARSLRGEESSPRWFPPLAGLLFATGFALGCFAVRTASANGSDFIAASSLPTRAINFTFTLAAALELRRSIHWHEERGLRLLWWALLAVCGRAALAELLPWLPIRTEGAWFPTAFVSLQVLVQVSFGIGTVQAILGVARTEELQREQRVSQLERHLLETQRRESLGQQAAGIAHDFRNILTAVQGSAYLGLASKGLNDEARNELEQIIIASGRGQALTEHLLAQRDLPEHFAPLTTGINERVRMLVPMLERLLPSGIAIDTVLCSEEPTADVDPTQFDQVMLNLVVNARDATTGPGRIRIETSFGQPSRGGAKSATGRWLRVAVTDTGSGMPADVVSKMFDHGFTTKSASGGSGLGLSTCFHVIRRHGGRLEVQSELGRGTTVSTYWPATPSPSAT